MKHKNNATSHKAEDYDENVINTIPHYKSFHQETINLIKSMGFEPEIWLDTGCGTGNLAKKAMEEFRNAKFLLTDPSEGMLKQAQKKLSPAKIGRIEFLKPLPTQKLKELEEKPDIITAIQCHHYLSKEDRKKVVCMCYKLLKEGGVFITFENIRPFTEKGIEIGKKYWENFQLSCGRNPEEIKEHLKRFDQEYFPITIEEHLKLLRETGFSSVELLWFTYMQAGFYCIK